MDHTHDPAASSWQSSANVEGADYPIQNLPFSVFRRAGTNEAFRAGVAIGDQVVDLGRLGLYSGSTLNELFARGPEAWRQLRHDLFARLRAGAEETSTRDALVPQSAVEFTVPARIGDYSDFYTSYYHALNIGKLFGISNDVVPANFHSIPIGYHGRASSIGVSGQEVRRPLGQTKRPDAAAPSFGPCAWLDYEMELGVFVGVGNALGAPVSLRDAESHIFGINLLNDWSARDIQGWEMTPLGPFLAKSFATTISPWIVTMDALAPFRSAWRRPENVAMPPVLPYLDTPENRENGALDIRVETWLETKKNRTRLAHTTFAHQHWTIAQMLAHHTIGGCNLQPGDLLGTGTISGPTAEEAGALMELAQAGRRPVLLDGEERGFLADGDSVVLRGYCERRGFRRIGFGECRGVILPALSPEDFS